MSGSPYLSRSQLDRSYGRSPLPRNQTSLGFSSLGNNPQPLNTTQTSSWNNSYNASASLSMSGRDSSGYLPGYLLSATQGMPLPEGSLRFEDPPLITSRSNTYSGLLSSSSGFGAEAALEQQLAQQPVDDNAPPTLSVLEDLAITTKTPDRRPLFPSHTSKPTPSATKRDWFEVIVFGFPAGAFSTTAKLFSGLGETSEPQPGPEGTNWFKIGFKHEWEAARAVRKNGELVNGAWMVGVKWADTSRGDFYASPAVRTVTIGDAETSQERPPSPPAFSNTSRFGKPIVVEPSSKAFKPPEVTDRLKDSLSGSKGIFGVAGW